MADCIACGNATPNPHNEASSQHHGQRPNASVRSESTVGASNWVGSTKANQINFFTFFTHNNQLRLWLIASPVAMPPPIRVMKLHPKTMGDAPMHRFGWNQWWGRAIEWDLLLAK
jgi:hypothetical protein